MAEHYSSLAEAEDAADTAITTRNTAGY